MHGNLALRGRSTLAPSSRRRGKFRSLFDDGSMVCENAHEPLVPRELFGRAQRMLRRRPTPGRYLLTGLVYLGDVCRLHGSTISSCNRKNVRRFYNLSPHEFEKYPKESDRPGFRADTIEQDVLAIRRARLPPNRPPFSCSLFARLLDAHEQRRYQLDLELVRDPARLGEVGNRRTRWDVMWF